MEEDDETTLFSDFQVSVDHEGRIHNCICLIV